MVFRKFKNYYFMCEWLSEKEHIQWEHWSKSLSKELEKLKEIVSNEETDNALHLIEDRLDRWSQNWKPYKELKEDIKEFDREWADKILNSLPFKCSVHQCGGEMIPKERKPPQDFIESEHFDGDEQTPDLICNNCGAVYQFKGFNKPKERKPPQDFIESEHFDGDEQTPDLICNNCGAVYQFKGFNKPEVTECDLSQKNKKEVRHSSHH